MGFTRYWTRTNKKITKSFCTTANQIVQECKKKGITLANGLGEEEPIISMTGIWINGNGNKDEYLTHETFGIDNVKLGQFDFCKTARKPYDYAVRLLLDAAKKEGLVTNVTDDDKGTYNEIISDSAFLGESEPPKKMAGLDNQTKVIRVLELLSAYLNALTGGHLPVENVIVDMQALLPSGRLPSNYATINQKDIYDVLKQFGQCNCLEFLNSFPEVFRWYTCRTKKGQHLFKNVNKRV